MIMIEMQASKRSSMKDYCQLIAPFLQPALVSSEALSRIYALTESLYPFSIACLECRLAENNPRVDFLADVRRGTLSIPEHFLNHPVWQDIQSFYQIWSKTTSFLHPKVRNLILEFDLENNIQTDKIPLPCLFLGVNLDSKSEVGNIIKLMSYIPSNILINQPNSRQFESNLQQCVNNLPEGAFIGHLGVMLSRSTQQVRLHIKGIPKLQIPEYLKKIGWGSKTSQLASLIENLSNFVDYFTLDLDIGEQIGLKIGIECYLEKQPPNETRWHSFFDYLVTEGLCSSAKKNALLAWPGITQKDECPETWPSNLYLGDTFLGSIALSVFYRAIYHIKVVYHPDMPLFAKAYLEFGHQWINRGLIEEMQSI